VRSQFIGRKRTSAALGILLSLAVAGGAFAYWTISGSGSGTATAGTVSAVTVNQTSTVSGLYPGGSPVTLAGTFTNPNSSEVYISSVTATVSAVTTGTELGKDPCTPADFAIGGSATLNAEIPSGPGVVGAWSGLTVRMLDTGANQDNCKNASVTISYTANP
jgi:hypothetical protein